MNEQSKARDIMIESVIALRPDMSLAEAWGVLYENRISGAPVVDRDGGVVGVLSQTDLMRENFIEGIGVSQPNTFYYDLPLYADDRGGRKAVPHNADYLLVKDAMTIDPICVSEDDTIPFLARTMRANHIHRVIVTSGKKLVGIVSSLDVLKVLELQ